MIFTVYLNLPLEIFECYRTCTKSSGAMYLPTYLGRYAVGSVTRLGDFLEIFLLQKTKVVQMFGLGFFLFQQLVMLMLKWNGIKAIHWLVVSIIKHRKSRFCLNWNNKNGEFKMQWTVLHKNRLWLAFMLTYIPRVARNNFFQFLNFPQKRFISSLVQFFFQWQEDRFLLEEIKTSF